MSCIRCEVTRARLLSAAWLLVGMTRADIAAKLTKRYGVAYVVDGNSVIRHNFPKNIPIIKG